MSSKDYLFPDLTMQACRMLEVIRRLMQDNKDYLDASPYEEETKRFLRSWFDKPIEGSGSDALTPLEQRLLGEDKWDALYSEIASLFTGLKNAKPSGADTQESMQYYKTMTGLAEKLLSYQERSLGIKQVHEFHNTVMQVMEDVLTPDQRNEVMEKLKNAISTG